MKLGRVAPLALGIWLAAGVARAAGNDDESSDSGGDSKLDQALAPEEKPDESGAKKKPEGKDAEPPPAGGDACIDENVRADLFAKRKRRDVRDRLFQQTNRHEFGVFGGYYTSDLFDGTYVAGAWYEYHMTEDFSVMASWSFTRINSLSAPELERNFALLGKQNRTVLTFDTDLVWDPAHGKFRLGAQIVHFDFYVAAGAGIVDSVLSSDIAGNTALGLKFFLGRAFAVRLELRDHAYRQQLLASTEWVNDLTSTLGVSIFLPMRQ